MSTGFDSEAGREREGRLDQGGVQVRVETVRRRLRPVPLPSSSRGSGGRLVSRRDQRGRGPPQLHGDPPSRVPVSVESSPGPPEQSPGPLPFPRGPSPQSFPWGVKVYRSPTRRFILDETAGLCYFDGFGSKHDSGTLLLFHRYSVPVKQQP